MKRIKVSEAARQLDIPEALLRTGLQTGDIPIGIAIEQESWTYIIYQEWVNEFKEKGWIKHEKSHEGNSGSDRLLLACIDLLLRNADPASQGK